MVRRVYMRRSISHPLSSPSCLRPHSIPPNSLTYIQSGCLSQLQSLDLAVNSLGEDTTEALLPLLFTRQHLPFMQEADLTFNGLDTQRAALQVAALRITHRANPNVKLERKSTVPIVRRVQGQQQAAPVAPPVVAPVAGGPVPMVVVPPQL